MCHTGVSCSGFHTKWFLLGQQVNLLFHIWHFLVHSVKLKLCVCHKDALEKAQLSGVVVNTERVAEGPHVPVQIYSLAKK